MNTIAIVWIDTIAIVWTGTIIEKATRRSVGRMAGGGISATTLRIGKIKRIFARYISVKRHETFARNGDGFTRETEIIYLKNGRNGN